MSSHQAPRTALVTGSSNGIGEAIVLELAKSDYRLVVTGRDAGDVTRVASKCSALSPSGSKPLEVIADLADEADVETLARRTADHFGGRLSLLVNNAGLGKPVAHTDPGACYSNYKRTMQVNLNAAVQLTLLLAEPLKRWARVSQLTGCVINVGSVAGFRPTESLAAYGISKAALNMHTSCMAVELAPLVRVNCICPGPIETKIIERSGYDLGLFREACSSLAPLARLGQPEEVAQLAAFLADPKRAAYITGANVTIDGGCNQAPVRWA